ncbi:MAG: nucleotidyl transferase AbiEii/AbiGii toxin family protein [Gammaproteobacteria bacterium]|nr:nucleotidyl transferase AbiEii/AbiGii toxin family protein [Gammaproteobacteria bacterium]
MFERPHHQRIAQVLLSLNAELLRENRCYFGGGTAIALRCGEYRESVDIDFLISDIECFRNLRQLLTSSSGLATIVRNDAAPLTTVRDIRADQYGIRTVLLMAEHKIKFEVVLEGRIDLEVSTLADEICGVATLTRADMAASKLLANSDRWADDSVFNRDLLDLAMLDLPLNILRRAVEKTEKAYGTSIRTDLARAIERFQNRDGWLDRCMQVMSVTVPKAVVWQRVRALQRFLSNSN